MYSNIQKLLDDNDMSYADLGKVLGISTQAVYRRMNGLAKWSVEEAIKLCLYFKNWDIEALFDLSN